MFFTFFGHFAGADPTPGHFPDILWTFWGGHLENGPRHFWGILGGVLAVAVRPMQPYLSHTQGLQRCAGCPTAESPKLPSRGPEVRTFKGIDLLN